MMEFKAADKKFFLKWVKALKSGKYTQTRKVLRDEMGYCCLGIACDLRRKNKKESLYKYAANNYKTFAGGWLLPVTEQEDLAALNDSGVSFYDIANYIERKYINT